MQHQVSTLSHWSTPELKKGIIAADTAATPINIGSDAGIFS